MLTDDPDTPKDGRWEVNVAYTDRVAPGERLRSVPHMDANYGWGDRIQLKYETGLVWRQPEGAATQSGPDDALLGLKWRFLDPSDVGASVSIYPQLQFENSSSSVARGLAEPVPSLFLPLETSRDFGPFAVVAEIGRQFAHGGDDQWTCGLLVAFPVVEGMELLAEYRRSGPSFFAHAEAFANVGFRLRISPHVAVLGSIGRGIAARADAPSSIAYLGLQFAFGKEGH